MSGSNNNRNLRKAAARACPVHMAVMERAVDELSKFGTFSKDAVLKALNLSAMEESLRWDYIREFIEQEQDAELVPGAAAYFKRHHRKEEEVNPAKFTAIGHGKKTAGYVAVKPENDHLVVVQLRRKQSMANGTGKAFQVFADKVAEKLGYNPADPQAALPPGD